jgi:hypothetical protein
VDERSHDDAEGILDAIAEFVPFARGTGPFVLVMGGRGARRGAVPGARQCCSPSLGGAMGR